MSKKKTDNNIDVYEITISLITNVTQALNIPSFAIQFITPQVKSVPKERLLQVLKLIYKELKKYESVLNE